MSFRRLLAAAAVLAPAPAAAADPPKPVPTAPSQTPTRPPDVPPDLADWTPRPAVGKAEPWEKATDKDWIDPRFRLMNTGPFLGATIDYPYGSGKVRNFKGLAVKVGDGAAVYDRATLRLGAAWAGGYLRHSDRRFALLNTPTMPDGAKKLFASPPAGGWAVGERFPVPESLLLPGLPLFDDLAGFGRFPRATAPENADVRYRGLYLHGGRVALAATVAGADVLESPGMVTIDGTTFLSVDVQVGPTKRTVRRFVADAFGLGTVISESFSSGDQSVKRRSATAELFGAGTTAGLVHGYGNAADAPRLDAAAPFEIVFPPSDRTRRVRITVGKAGDINTATGATRGDPPPDLTPLTTPGLGRWGKPLLTKLERGSPDGPFAVDTLTLPTENPFKALFFCTGVDFLPDGRVAVCTAHGDVWLATVDEKADRVTWQRFATGLYQPLGLKVVDGKVVVLERGQLTRLHDGNGDGEADFYENVCNLWHTGNGEHSFDTCLETDPAGNFYFFKTGDPDVPNGGCLVRVSKDGKTAENFATGFRHPIGLGASPTGVITGADQEGNWMPATRIDEYRRGGFYGDMRTHQRPTPPETYDGPLCWLPREVDNSAGGQVWVPADATKWGALAGLPLHLSYGRCKAFVLLRQVVGDVTQGGVADLGLRFLSGVCRGRFGPDGNLYVVGLNGWQTSAKADGCVQRVRPTGKPFDLPVKLAAVPEGVELTFSRPLDRSAADPDKYRVAWWGYRWTKDYGSKRYKVSDPNEVGQDDVPVTAAELLPDGRTVRLSVKGGQKAVMQMQVGYNVAAADGKPVVGSVYLTVHKTAGR